MIEGGKGGANTLTGLKFEKRSNLQDIFAKVKGYSVSGFELKYKGKVVGEFHSKHKLYSRFLDKLHIDWKKMFSKKLLPDEALFVFSNKTLFIIEMKFQKVAGSVDEKLQTCDFKRKQYQKLFVDTDIHVEYIYLLNEWFEHHSYKDTLRYVREVGCEYYVNDLPLSALGLPEPEEK